MDHGWLILIVVAMFYLVPAIIFLASLLAIFWPKAAWYLSEGWKYRGVEPSSLALVMTRIGGFFGCIFSVVFLVVVITMMPVKFGPGVPGVAPVQAPAPK